MISIIVCSRDKAILATISENVASTIGVAYEIIAIDNSAGQYGICQAYNIGAQQSRYGILCFVHEDILFHTVAWGTIVRTILADESVGVLGVAGGVFQPKAPAGWMGGGQAIYMNIIHTTGEESKRDYINPTDSSLVKVAAVDGVWMCCRKAVWETYKFDPLAVPGFHFYDVDFCARVSSEFTNYVTFKVTIEHFSRGSFDRKWVSYAIDFYRKRQDILPFGIVNPTANEQKAINLKAFQNVASLAISLNASTADVLYCLKKCLTFSLTNRDTLYLVRIFLVSKISFFNH